MKQSYYIIIFHEKKGFVLVLSKIELSSMVNMWHKLRWDTITVEYVLFII